MEKIKIKLIALILFAIAINTNAQTKGTFTDKRDGKTYKTVKIGKQVWIAENLAFKADNGCWAYGNDESNVKKYGYLYNWETANNVCPQGFHLTSYYEWEELVEYASSLDSAVFTKDSFDWENMGKYLKAKSGWDDNGNGIDKFGFTALPGGIRGNYGISFNIGKTGGWWSTYSAGGTEASFRSLESGNKKLMRKAKYQKFGYSVRCIKD